MTSRQDTDVVGVSNGSAFYILAALVEKGFLKLRKVKEGSHKGSYVNLLLSKGTREKLFLTHRFIDYEREGFEGLTAEIEILDDEVGFAGSTKLVSELKND